MSFEVAAPIQITRNMSLAAMIMSAPVNRNVTVSAPYTSPRAARKITLSRRPAMASSPRTVAVCQLGSRPVAAGLDSSANSTMPRNAA
ncbi:Uncharacterised protein [Mycobacteroides abscessus subsp. abscessus]|nr:Uncharacterised protein [Mycobacteroides abscessus subsp. abscessus]